jgi:hypothetical protein
MRKPTKLHRRPGVFDLDDPSVTVLRASLATGDATPDRLVAAARRLQAALDARALPPVVLDGLGGTGRKR